MGSSGLLIRRLASLGLILLSGWIWTRHGDVAALIVSQRPVLFGRYSQGEFGSLLVITPILWTLASALWSRRALRPALVDSLIGIASTLIAIIAITYFTHFFHREARYVETPLPTSKNISTQLAGAVRRRPPNQLYELVFSDVPEQARTYPDAPPGYGDVKIRLTTDANGFRNTELKKHYDIVAVGDSFVAGSNVSDEQVWTQLLAKATDAPIYNLGVGGSGPPTYMSNYVYFGVDLTPRIALFMIYEGNDFKEDVVLSEPVQPTLSQRIADHIDMSVYSSPVTLGLQRLSHDLFERLGSTRPVPGYQEKLGFMPIKLGSGDSTHYYAFEPKRAIYLNYSVDEFSTSPEWRATATILRQIVQISRDRHTVPVFIYAPSVPHVILPLVKDSIPAEQLHYFISLKKQPDLPAEAFKRQLFANLDSEQTVVMDFCRQEKIDCVALTDMLRAATAAGQQTYFTYDQHWTPAGHAVVAKTIEQFLREKNLLN